MITQKTPVQQINDFKLNGKGIELFVLREDLNHPYISGNKLHKLRYNLEEAKRQGKDTLLTFGGAYSNHIAATAAAGKELGFKTIGIIRGEEDITNLTLNFAKKCGMQLQFIDRSSYREKHTVTFIDNLKKKQGDFYLLPEGGSNELAVKGCAEILSNIALDFDVVCCSVGTGVTLAGLIRSLKKNQKAIGFSSLKGGAFLNKEVEKYLSDNKNNWQIATDYHFGGYAKATAELKEFIKAFTAQHAIPLDHVYTGKMLYGIYDMIVKNRFSSGTKILAVHTGGFC